MSQYPVPAVSVTDVALRLASGEALVILDVREPDELLRVRLDSPFVAVPLSELAAKRERALPAAIRENKAAEVIVMCHHGVRSAQVVAWMTQQGWTQAYNLTGGIDAFARQVAPELGFY